MKTPKLCVYCKGSRHLCGHAPCPLLARYRIMPTINKAIKKEFFGPSPSIFIGYSGYPNVAIGPMASLEEKPQVDDPSQWFGQNYSDIIKARSLNLRSKHKESVRSYSKLVQMVQEIALATKPTDVELHFKNKPTYKVSFSNITQPEGPVADLRKAYLTGNVRVARHVDRIVSDELKAAQSANLLYNRGEDVYKINTILSSGILGVKDKRMVPTRWSITATDDIIAKELLKKVRDFPSINEYLVFKSNYLDNKFIILMIPGNWEYENFEAWHPGSTWYQGKYSEPIIIEEYEPFKGRTAYADKEAGGYYAARLATIEALHNMKRQARVVVFREISSGYTIPMGVWVVRETARNAFKTDPQKFNNLDSALKYIGTQLKNPLDAYITQSNILKQKRLSDFFN
ncbi:MAG: hypothetical protein JSW73_03075 [Candidatus Woesearchaeota archaeon]|nr:MAG: hypothetical protein JSW73_03075 [Candidatus Woesearchaeota archaeon]